MRTSCFRKIEKWKNFLAFPGRMQPTRQLSMISPPVLPRVHILKGFSDFRPRKKVIDTIQEKIFLQQTKKIPPFDSGSFFVLDISEVEANLRLWQENLPEVLPHYAVKCNPQPDILNYFANQPGVGFDVASKREMEQVLHLKVHPSRLIFGHPMKPLSHIEHAFQRGMRKIVFDSVYELHKLRSVSSDWDLFLRFWVDDTRAQCVLGNKYGALEQECEELFMTAKQLNLEIKGLTFHCGSGCQPDTFIEGCNKS